MASSEDEEQAAPAEVPIENADTAEHTSPDPAQAALDLAALGFAVSPLARRSKIPLKGTSGCKDATRDPERIRAMFTDPNFNIGIATGAPSACLVLDVDPRHGGMDSFRALEREHGDLPRTVGAQTGGGGFHIYFKMPADGRAVGNSVSKIGPGLDVRGDGGYVVAAPSVTDAPYRWLAAPGQIAIADAPAWLLALLTAPAPARDVTPANIERTATPEQVEHAMRIVKDAGLLTLIKPPGRFEQVQSRVGQISQRLAPHAHAGKVTDGAALAVVEHVAAVAASFGPPKTGSASKYLDQARSWFEKTWATDLANLEGSAMARDALGFSPKVDAKPVDLADVLTKLRHHDNPNVKLATHDDPLAAGDKREPILREVCATIGREHCHTPVAVLWELIRVSVTAMDGAPAEGTWPALAERLLTEAQATGLATQSNTIDVRAPHAVAELFVASRKDADGFPEIVRWQGAYYVARGTFYEPLTKEALRADLYRFLKSKWDGKGAPIEPNRDMVNNVEDALQAVTLLPVRGAPAWIGAQEYHPASEYIAFPNGLLHVPTRTSTKPTRAFFNLNAVTYEYDPNAPAPSQWLKFLSELWPDDPTSIATLQEIFGLALTPDTSFHKIFMFVGATRGGKGVISDVLAAIVGPSNVDSPEIDDLGEPFGKASLIGKTLAIVPDARVGRKTDLNRVSQTLLTISGTDTVNIQRKFLGPVSTKLSVRFLIVSNEVPALFDQSSALANRFIILKFTKSWRENPDLGLKARLLRELQGICVWALEGLDRLRERGHFIQPNSALEVFNQLEELTSPTKAFVNAKCVIEASAHVAKNTLFQTWLAWCAEQNRTEAGTQATFGKNLSSAFPAIGESRPKSGDTREWHYTGIRPRTAADNTRGEK